MKINFSSKSSEFTLERLKELDNSHTLTLFYAMSLLKVTVKKSKQDEKKKKCYDTERDKTHTHTYTFLNACKFLHTRLFL